MLHQAFVIVLALAASPPEPPAATTKTTGITDKTFQQTVLAPRAGRAVLVSFWATYCQPCLEELPALLKLRKKLDKHGADIVFVNVDPPGDPASVLKVLQKRGLALGETYLVDNEDPQPFIEAVDPKWAGEVLYGAVYGPDGKLVARFSGERPMAEIELALMQALQKPPQAVAGKKG